MRSLLLSFRQFWSGSRSRAGNVAIIFSLAISYGVMRVGTGVVKPLLRKLVDKILMLEQST